MCHGPNIINLDRYKYHLCMFFFGIISSWIIFIRSKTGKPFYWLVWDLWYQIPLLNCPRIEEASQACGSFLLELRPQRHSPWGYSGEADLPCLGQFMYTADPCEAILPSRPYLPGRWCVWFNGWPGPCGLDVRGFVVCGTIHWLEWEESIGSSTEPSLRFLVHKHCG